MEKNVGGFDRTARLIGGPILLLVGLAWLVGMFALDLWLGAVVLLVGAILTVTGVTRKCPANSILGMNTFRRGGESEEASTERASR
jgi:hypothetical protein